MYEGDNLETKDRKMLSYSNFSCLCTAKVCSYASLNAPVLSNEKDRQRQQQFRDYSEKLDVFKSMEPPWIHSRVLKELVHMYTSLLPTISEKL